MNRLVVVSNRVTRPQETHAGGLAAAMRDALAEHGGLWFGWSGELVARKKRKLHRESAGAIDYALLDLTEDEHDDYYLGFSNRTLWPLLHFQPTVMQFDRDQYAGYRQVNKLFAQKLAPLLRPEDRIWVQDYHLIPLASELRALGVKARIGFFLHIPLPPPQVLQELPCHAELMRTLLAYDLVGLQIADNAESLQRYFVDVHGADCSGDTVTLGQRHTRVAAFPIGIDTAGMAQQARAAVDSRAYKKLRESMDDHKLVIGVDRLDYSKGIPQRMEAFGRFLTQHEDWCGKVSLLQIAPPSREEVPEYQELRTEIEQIVGATNGRYARPSWMPIRYVNHSFAQSKLAGFYRLAHVGLVTPLRDGMNLVAKEFIAAQDPDNPGALVLSRFAGAAHEFPQAVLVNPYDPDELVESILRALTMSRDERRARWEPMFERISSYDIAAWRKDFLRALEREPRPLHPVQVITPLAIRIPPNGNSDPAVDVDTDWTCGRAANS